ncbi:hypothetical protein FIBSPDRAFT_875157 [Athelia psychrophila]|uniref:Uncharacterized protein n=1 Tax=Athelia psychrophila TaxID=1759441 RepID=A0A165WLF9_9AGAM|nr:hypothetical protein FIBSPDRAFT_875157 [Fibularhizoctonia sp. CBS 109695]
MAIGIDNGRFNGFVFAPGILLNLGEHRIDHRVDHRRLASRTPDEGTGSWNRTSHQMDM